MLGLKRLLDEKAGGLIDFFLSSDDDSIAHGTIWPAEVRAALDRMSLMLIFVSPEALKSGWTYFEAGYGLHKLNSAKIYCLPGTDKGSLPAPFNLLQNRNLHSHRDINLLVKQINESLGASLKDSVSQEEFARIFKKPLMVQVETTPSFERLVRDVTVSAKGPANSADVFAEVCKKKDFGVSKTDESYFPPVAFTVCPQDEFVSTGLRLNVHRPKKESFLREIPIDDRLQAAGSMTVYESGPNNEWKPIELGGYYLDDAKQVSLAEVKSYNARIRKENDERRLRNEVVMRGPRECSFSLAATNISVPIGIIDEWLKAGNVREPIEVGIHFAEDVQTETRIEGITAKVHGSELSLKADGSYLWRDKAAVQINWFGRNGNHLKVTSLNSTAGSMSGLQIQELIATLYQLNIISLPTKQSSKRRR